MSAVILKIVHGKSGFAAIYVDGRNCGKIEDPEQEIGPVIKKLIKELEVENTEVVEERL